MQDLAPPPATLLDATGAPQKGAYAGRIASAEFKGARLGGWRKKAWRYAGVFRDDLAIGAAIADLGYLGLTFVYVAEGGRFYECAWKSPAAAGMRVGAADGTSVALAPGRMVTLATTRAGGVTVSLALPGIRADLDIEGGATPLTVVSDVGGVAGRTGMTVKSAGLLTRGTLCVQGRSYTLDDARACLDFTQALFPRRTVWSWAAGRWASTWRAASTMTRTAASARTRCGWTGRRRRSLRSPSPQRPGPPRGPSAAPTARWTCASSRAASAPRM